MENAQLQKGKIYLVKHSAKLGNGREVISNFTRRLYKGTEKRFDLINCFVFSAKIEKNVSVTFDESGDTTFWHWHWSGRRMNVPNEISIPEYCIEEIKEA